MLDKIKYSVVTEKELFKISSLKTPNKVVAIVEKVINTLNYDFLKKEIFLVLDGINNPGNLGTIIRLADWFDVSTIVPIDPNITALYFINLSQLQRSNHLSLVFEKTLLTKTRELLLQLQKKLPTLSYLHVDLCQDNFVS